MPPPSSDYPAPPRPKKAPSARRAGALLASILLHGSFALFASTAGQGGIMSAGGGASAAAGVHGFHVTLSSDSSGAPSQPQDPVAALMADLARGSSAQHAVIRTDTRSRAFEEVFQHMHSDAAEDGGGDRSGGADGQGSSGKSPSPARSKAEGRPADRPGQDTQNRSTGDLWGQIEPCWRDLPGVSAVPVTLELSLDRSGRLADPPEILRPPSAKADEARLLAEARAIAALSACIPYQTSLLSRGGSFRVEFMTTK